MRHRRRAFTVLEILVVIGIILVLMSIAVIGFHQLERSANGKQTESILENARAIAAEYETAGGDMTAVNNLYTAAIDVSVPASPNPGDVTDNGGGAATPRFASAAVTKTQNVMAILSHTPAARDMLQKIPPQRIFLSSTGQPFASSATVGPIFTDGWNNPIIFVPTTGIKVLVNFGTPNQQVVTLRAVDRRPFWASAGPDGDFTKGDDNVYSTSVRAN